MVDYTTIVNKFKNREIKAKEIFDIREISKDTAYPFVSTYHYLGKAKFFSMYNYGLFIRGTTELIGVATYTPPQGANSLRGWFNDISNDDMTIMELSRLCLMPIFNGTNATSYLLSNSIKALKKYGVRAVITLADSSRHVGSIYQVCNFRYYGLTPERNIFYTSDARKNPRIVGKKEIRGVWVKMPRKHRYAFIIDKHLKVLHQEETPPKVETEHSSVCVGCNDNRVVFDTRFEEYYTCPMCTSKLVPISIEDANRIQGSSNKENSAEETISKTIGGRTSVESLW